MFKVDVTINGLPPGILLHNPAAGLMGGNKTGKKPTIPPPEDEAAAGLYWTEDSSSIAFPSWNIHRAMTAGAAGFKLGKRAMSPYIAGSLTFLPVMASFNTTNYRVDIRRAVIQRQGIMRSRPNLFPWELSFIIQVAEEDFPNPAIIDESLKAIMEDTGRRIGIGDFRPGCKGPFGRFQVTRWEVSKI